MWPLPTIRYEHVIVHIDQETFSIGWLSADKRQVARLNAYHTHEFQMLTHALLCHTLETFIAKYRLSGALLSISVSSPFIYEELIQISHAHATSTDFQTSALTKLLWDFRYLHPLSDGNHLFYVCGINRPTLFSYQLLATQNRLHIVSISSWYNTLMQAYKTIFGPAFRTSQLAMDMEQTKYQLHDRLTTDSISRLLQVGSDLIIDKEKEKKALISMIGLYYQERAL